MSDILEYALHGHIAVLTLNQAPVNSLGVAMRTAIDEAFSQALADERVAAIVISSKQALFCGGADISEFGSPKAFASPSLPDLCNKIEASTKPVVAAINGMALGGGCELALACDYRVAHSKARLGLPEVHLGLIPGAGGTQRLPRLANPQLALEMIVSGKPKPVTALRGCGLIDFIPEQEQAFDDTVQAYTEQLVSDGAVLKSCAEIRVEPNSFSAGMFDDFRASIARKTRGFFAPEQCIKAVEAACSLTLEAGLAKEAELFKACMDTPQARAQQHLFFAERSATKIPGIKASVEPRSIKSVAVIGSGTMGGGIAMNFINSGIPTTLLDLSAEALERGINVIRRNYEISAQKGRMSTDDVECCMALLTPSTSYDDLGQADLVIEAVFENMDVKKKVFSALDANCKPGCILATNTSTLNVNEIAAATGRPEDVIGLHFFSPANVMRLLEIVRAEKTADEVVVSALKMAKSIGKVPAVVGVCFGFVGNRMLEPYGREASRLLLEGASPTQIDKAITEFGMAMGPLAMSDLAGIDVGYLVRESRREEIAHEPSYQIVQDKLYELGRYGQKTGRGNYIYDGRKQIEDPEVIDLARDTAAALGIAQREISAQEIIERTIYMLINEGAYILEEGISYRASDCDLIWVNGYGFPAWRGGPMHFADEIGLQNILAAIEKHRSQLGEYGEKWFTPAPLLKQLAAEGKTFGEYINPKYA